MKIIKHKLCFNEVGSVAMWKKSALAFLLNVILGIYFILGFESSEISELWKSFSCKSAQEVFSV